MFYQDFVISIGKIYLRFYFITSVFPRRIPIPVAYSMYLYRYKGKQHYMDFAFTFLLTNLLGFVVYYIIPAA